MNEPLTRRWVGVVLLWGAAAALLALDLGAVGRITRARRAREERTWNARFVDQHAEEMEQAIDLSRTLGIDSPSFELAKLTIEETVQHLARAAGIRDALAEYRLRSADQSVIDVALGFSAPVAAGLGLIESIERDCPHLRLESVAAQRSGTRARLDYEVEIRCDVRLESGGDDG